MLTKVTETPLTDREASLRRGRDALIQPASRWMQDALTAWAEDDHGKVALAAPQSVELLGKAVLWDSDPALLVPLQADAEASLFILVQRPDLNTPKLRTIGLKLVLGRLDTLLGGLPIDGRQRARMVDTRNGAIHVGTAEQSRYVLIDCLTISEILLQRLGRSGSWFYGDHHRNVEGLLQVKRTEVQHQVAAKRARSRMLLQRLEEELESSQFDEFMAAREAAAEYDIDPSDYGSSSMYAISQDCPECGMAGRLIGEVDVTHEVEYDQIGEGDFEVLHEYFMADLLPTAFACNVCKLNLYGQQELAACDLPASRITVDDDQLGQDFNARELAD